MQLLEDMFFPIKSLNILENLDPSVGGEVQLTDAIKLMLDDEQVVGHIMRYKFDCGSKAWICQCH